MLNVEFQEVEEAELGTVANPGSALCWRAFAVAPKEFALVAEALVSQLTLGSLLLDPAPCRSAAVPAARYCSADVATASGASLLLRSYDGPSMPPSGGG